jgi:hypothetical protein
VTLAYTLFLAAFLTAAAWLLVSLLENAVAA